ncbi:LytTR family transcriptional regulator DNA-binding domain-containing protein [Dorea longicatena]
MRTHQSFLVNCDYVFRCGTKLIELTDGQRIPVSEDQHKKIREQYSRFIRKDIFND